MAEDETDEHEPESDANDSPEYFNIEDDHDQGAEQPGESSCDAWWYEPDQSWADLHEH